jgi:hypothetical protein
MSTRQRVWMLLIIALTAMSVQSATIGLPAAKPTGDVLAQSDPDGTDGVGFDSELSGATRYAWGQSFTVDGTGWTIDAISLQKHFNPPGAADAGRQLKIAIFPMADFDDDAFGTFSDPFAGQATVPVYVETFDASALVPQNNWVTFDLTTNPALPAGSYGFAVWINGTESTADWNWKSAGTYAGGQRLQVRGDTGNVLQTSDLNFVVQGIEQTVPGGALVVGEKPSSSILAEQATGANLLGFDAEERDPNTRHAWGQSFTAVTGWTLSSIAVEAGSTGVPADSDTRMKVAVFEYNENTFTNDSWGTFSDPFSNAVTTVLYEETFDMTNSATGGNWIAMSLSSNLNLTAGMYGFALWKSDPPDGSASILKWGDGYDGGGRLRVHNDFGNTIEDGDGTAGDMNFVLQGEGTLAIAQFEASETDLLAGETTTLSWFAIESESVTIDLEGGDNVVTTIDQSGSVVVTPPVGTSTYVMVAANATDGSVTSSVEIVVTAAENVLMLTAFDDVNDLGSEPEQYEDTPGYVINDLGPTVDYDCTAAYGDNATSTEMGIKTSDGKNFIGTTCRQMTGTVNGLADAIANGVYIEMRLDSSSNTGYTLGSIDLDTLSVRGQGGDSSWGIALLYDLNGDSSYTADELLGQIEGTFPAGTVVTSTNLTLSTLPEMVGVVDPTFRFYLWENYDSAYAGNNLFGIESITLNEVGLDDYTTPVISSIEIVDGEMVTSISNLAVFAVSKLQGKEDLLDPVWVDIATTTGVADVEWVLPTTNPVSFFRVITE